MARSRVSCAVVASVLAELQGQELYRQIFADNRAIKLLIDPATGEIVDANEAAAQFYGYPIEVLRATNIRSINTLPPTEVEHAMNDARSSDRTHFRFTHRIASGEQKRVEVFSGPLDHGGRALLFSIIQDITDRERLEQQLRDLQRMEAVGRLAGGVAHDFNNLLLVILNANQLMARKLPEQDPLRMYVDHVELAATRAAELTRELLLFARGVEPTTDPIDLQATISELAPLLRGSLGSMVTLELDLPMESFPVLVPRPQLEQVLVNLAVNARDAMPTGGTITISLSRSPASFAELVVRDTGIGMTPEVASHIFEPFFTTKERGRGTGLGLAITYGIVSRAGGRISVTSTPGAGTAFSLALPLARRRARPTPPQPLPTVGGGETILVVDDEPLVRSTIVDALEEHGYVAVGVASAVEAEAWAIAAPKLDLVLTDVVMPKTTGPELVARLRSVRPELRVLYMSGYTGGNTDVADADVLAKPFDHAELTRRIAARLRR